MRASDIDRAEVLDFIGSHPGHSGIGVPMHAIADRFPEFPEAVVRAKLNRMVRKGYLNGCTCGCRGDFTLTKKGRETVGGIDPPHAIPFPDRPLFG